MSETLRTKESDLLAVADFFMSVVVPTEDAPVAEGLLSEEETLRWHEAFSAVSPVSVRTYFGITSDQFNWARAVIADVAEDHLRS